MQLPISTFFCTLNSNLSSKLSIAWETQELTINGTLIKNFSLSVPTGKTLIGVIPVIADDNVYNYGFHGDSRYINGSNNGIVRLRLYSEVLITTYIYFMKVFAEI